MVEAIEGINALYKDSGVDLRVSNFGGVLTFTSRFENLYVDIIWDRLQRENPCQTGRHVLECGRTLALAILMLLKKVNLFTLLETRILWSHRPDNLFNTFRLLQPGVPSTKTQFA